MEWDNSSNCFEQEEYLEIQEFISKYNLSIILISNDCKYSDTTTVKLLENINKGKKHLLKIINMDDFVCLYSKRHSFGIINSIGNLSRFKYITKVTEDENGFKPCNRISKLKMIDITDFCRELHTEDIIKIVINYYDEYSKYIFSKNGKAKQGLLDALGYEKGDPKENEEDLDSD